MIFWKLLSTNLTVLSSFIQTWVFPHLCSMRGFLKKIAAVSSNLGFSGAKGRKHWLGSSFSGYLNFRQAQSVHLFFIRNFKEGEVE